MNSDSPSPFSSFVFRVTESVTLIVSLLSYKQPWLKPQFFNSLLLRLVMSTATYLHIRVGRYQLEGARSVEVLSIVLYIRSPSKNRGRSTWLDACTDRTTSLCLTRINVAEPLSSVMDTDRVM